MNLPNDVWDRIILKASSVGLFKSILSSTFTFYIHMIIPQHKYQKSAFEY